MKNILFVTQRFGIGGITKVNITIANELQKKGYKVSLLVLDELGNPPLSPEFRVLSVAKSQNMIQYLSGISGKVGLNFIARKVLKYYAAKIDSFVKENKIDTVVFNEYTIPLIALVNQAVKKIAWCHQSSHMYIGKEAVRYFRYTQRFLFDGLTKADLVICLTSYDYETFSEYNNNTKVFYNPVTIDKGKVSELNQHIISWTGRLRNPQKGIDYLAEVASKLPEDWKIQVAGDGNKEEFDSLLKKFGAEERIIYSGSLSGKKLQEHYSNSSIYLMTSRYEGMPLVLAEAMSFGLPVVAFEQNGSREVLDDGKYGLLVENGDIVKIGKALITLIEHPEKRREISRKSLKRVKDFELENIIKQWEEVL